MAADTVTGADLTERSRAVLASARRFAHEAERLALLADELELAAEEAVKDSPLSVGASVDIARRARGIASDVRQEEDVVTPAMMLDEARELVALIDFFTERAAAEEAADA